MEMYRDGLPVADAGFVLQRSQRARASAAANAAIELVKNLILPVISGRSSGSCGRLGMGAMKRRFDVDRYIAQIEERWD